MLLQQRLLGENGIFDDELKKASDVVSIQMMSFTKLNQAFQQIALAIDVPHRAVGIQLGFTHFHCKRTAFGQQRQ
ncbi:hypothetical protein D3C80_1523180 [compost metagenome]